MGWTIESIQTGHVDPAAVFALYLDPTTWSEWGHNATWARSDGPLVEGGTVEVRAGYGTVYRCQVRRLEPGRALELVVRPALLTIINIYEVERADAGARVRHAFEVSGPMASVARLALARSYRRQLDDEVRAVIRMAGGQDPRLVDRADLSGGERVWHGFGRAGRRARGRRD